ncbi:hypothetical protein [Streptomyces sp. NA02536]|uniref:hypothetical protein n=1 Tax=Streptomyces sp. NA02536 TaxID=2742133 RepID=UPI0015910700|nr:hypothetical protein [Streptomyces sp. NA02536]QKW04498.1 hypothetical protein HUT14_34045 [Streptomyces sp. NA02536]
MLALQHAVQSDHQAPRTFSAELLWQADQVNREHAYQGRSVMWGTVLPSRVAYLIEAGSTDGFRTAVRAASARWGGICELIIEVDPVSGVTAAAHDLVTRAELEAAVRVDVAGEFAVSLALS